MSDDKAKEERGAEGSARREREDKLAAALRANLRRRKAAPAGRGAEDRNGDA